MKRFMLFSFLGFLVLLASVEPVDGHELGIKAGVSHSRAGISGEIPWITFKSMQDFSAGIYFSLNIFGERLGLQPEVNYTIKGFSAREMDGAEEIFSKYKISYLEFPVLVYHKIPLRGKIKPKLFMGPYLGLPQKVTEVQTAFGNTEKRDVGSNLKELDAGLVFGGSVQYPLGSVKVTLDVRYSLGFANLSRDITQVAYEFQEGDTIKNRALTLTVGVGFRLGSSSSPR